MRRTFRLGGYIALGVATGLLIALALILVIARTEWGLTRVRNVAFDFLDDRIEGTLTFDRISGGLLSGVRVHGFGIVDPRGREFLYADSVALSYSLRTLIRGQIVLDRVVLYSPRVALERLPGDSVWNYQLVFPPDATPSDPSQRRLVLFNDARIIDGTAWVRTAYEPDGPVSPADTARMVLEEVPGGLVRTMRFDNLNARLDRVIWESPIEKGRLFEIAEVSGRGFVWEDPFHITDGRGTLTMRDSVVAFDMPQVDMPSSRASVLGRVVSTGGENRFDVLVQTRTMAFRDVRWVYPGLPEEGGGSMRLRIQSRPDGLLFLAEDANLEAPGTRLTGTVGVVTGDSLYFTQVNLRASPLDVDLLEQMLPGGLPVDGLLVGTVEVRGPLSALQTRGDVRLDPRGGGTASSLAWNGVFDVRNGVRARNVDADIRRLELALLQSLTPDLPLTGSVSGNVRASGSLRSLQFTGRLEHASSDGGRSTFDGGGSIEGGGRSRRVQLDLNVSPASIQDLATYVPALRGLQGELRGPVHLAGTADDLSFQAELLGAAGPLSVDGTVRGRGDDRHVAAVLASPGFRLDLFRPGLPPTLVAGRATADLTGADLATLRGPLQVLLDSARIGEMPVANLGLWGGLDSGALVVDSSVVRSIIGVGRARGRLALLDGGDGTMEVAFNSDNLAPLEPYVFDEPAAVDAEPRVSGRGDALFNIIGWLGDLRVQGRAAGQHLAWGVYGAADLTLDLDAQLADASRSFRLAAAADSLRVWRHVFDEATLAASGRPDSAALRVATRRDVDGMARGLIAALEIGSSSDSLRLRLDSLQLHGRSNWTLAAPVNAVWRGGLGALGLLELRGPQGASVTVGGVVPFADTANAAADRIAGFRLELRSIPFDAVLAALNVKGEGEGVVQGSLQLSGSALDPLWEGEVSATNVRYGDVRIDRAFAELSYSGFGLDAHAEAQHHGRAILSAGGRVPLDLRLVDVDDRRLAQPLRVTLRADSLPLALPLGALDGFTGISGRVDGLVTLAGTSVQPSLSGGFSVADAELAWNVPGVRYRDVRGRFTLVDDHLLSVDSLVATTADAGRGTGSGRVTGTLDLSELTDPGFNLDFTADRIWAARRRDVEANVSGRIRLAGQYSQPTVSGSVRVEEGTLFIDELYRQFFTVGLELDDPALLTLVDTTLVAVRPLLAASKNPFLRNLTVSNMQLAVAQNAWLRSRDMDVLVSGDLNVALNRREEDLRLTGALNVERGTYTLFLPPFARRFQVDEGMIEFPGTPGIDPNLSITASYRARAAGEPLPVVATVTGTLRTPRIRLSTDAAQNISESDLASYLFFGVPSWQLANAGNIGGSSMVRDMSVRALTPSLLGYASSGLQVLGQNAGLFDYVSLTAADALAGTTGSDGVTGLLSSTQLEVGRYIGDLYFGLTQRLATDAFTQPAVRMEWRFSPQYSFELFAEDRLARSPGFGLNRDVGLRKVYGLSLFREWSF